MILNYYNLISLFNINKLVIENNFDSDGIYYIKGSEYAGNGHKRFW